MACVLEVIKMLNKVGSKGQVVIEKKLRDRLGFGPGWVTVQRLADDHIEMYFLPSEHNRSLKGSLAKYTSVTVAPGSQWDEARDKAWQSLIVEKWQRTPPKGCPSDMIFFPFLAGKGVRGTVERVFQHPDRSGDRRV
jgi:bifunctional DNA-binding transcriptional regulator/antitoxin component of YhaV-PrlF toxin-antitoxin module